MREIKFRAYHKTQGCMYYTQSSIGMEGDGWIESIDFDSKAVTLGCQSDEGDYIDMFSFSEVELMQYTGLKDKNGKEIYEGDVIRSVENDEVLKIGDILPLTRHLDLLAENIGYYEGKKYHLRSAGAQYHLDDWVSNPEFYEIIGNIYENPELLTNTHEN
jgi:uncharacterized phage protein (TIGR01671 family)